MFTLHELFPAQGNSLHCLYGTIISIPRLLRLHLHPPLNTPPCEAPISFLIHPDCHCPLLAPSHTTRVRSSSTHWLFWVLGPWQSHLHRSPHTTLAADQLIFFANVVATSQVHHKLPRHQSRYHLTSTTNEGTLKMSPP